MAIPAATIEIRGRFDDRRLEQDVRKSLNRIERSAKKIDFSKAQRGLRPLGTGLSKATAQADEFTKSLEASNARVLAFGASAGAFYAVGTAIKEMVTQTIEVEKRLAMINVLMGQTSGKLKEFGHSLFSVAKQTGQTFDEVATAANELVRQGLDMNTTLKRTKDAMILVRMSGMDAKLAVDSLTAAINGFNEAGLDSTRVVNVMANVAANFAVSETDLAEAIRRSGSTAKEAGVNFKQLAAIVTAAQQRTARGGAVIGNAFKSIFTKIHRPRTLDALEAVGIKTRDASGQLQSSLKILENMAKAYDRLSDSQKSQITQLMGGLYQVNILKAAVRDLSDSYSLYNNALDVANKTTDEATMRNQKLNLTLSAMINRVVEGSKEMAAMLGGMAVGPGLEGLFKSLDKIISAITNLKADSGWAKVIKGVFEGLGAFLTGPGLAIGVALIGKLAITFGRFLTTSVASILELNTGARNHASLQKIITAELAAQPGLVKSLAAQGLSNLQIQRQVLAMLAAQGTQLAANAKFAASTAAMGVRGGMIIKGGAPTGGRIRAKGHIPNFNKQDTMAESVGAALGGYKPGQIKTMEMPGVGKVTYNSAEKVSPVPGFSQPFISPPQNSKAGKAHRKQAISQIGIDPYTLSDGFVPNFGMMMSRLSRGSMTKTSKTEVVDDAMGARYDKFLADLRNGRIKSKSGVTARDLERAEYGIMEAAPRFNARDMGQYGFNPFLGRGILKRDVDPVLSKLGYSGGFVPNFMVGSMAQRMSATKAARLKEHGSGASTQQYLADFGWRNKNQVEWFKYMQKQRGGKDLDFLKLSDDYASFIPHRHQFDKLGYSDKRLAMDNVLAASQKRWEGMKTSPGLHKAMQNRFDGFVPGFSMAALMKWAQTAKAKDLTQLGRGAEGTAWRLGEGYAIKAPTEMKAADVLKGLRKGTKGTYDDIAKRDPMMAMRLDALAFEGAVTKAAAKSGIPVEGIVGHAPAAGIVKKLVTPLHKTSLGQMGMLDSKFIYDLREAMVVKGLTGKNHKFLTNDLLKADNFSVRNVEKFEKAFLEGATAKSMVDKGLIRILDAGSFQQVHSKANFANYFKKHGPGSVGRNPEAIAEYVKRAEGDYGMAKFLGLGGEKAGVRFMSGGFVPGFSENPLERSIRGEKLGIQMSGRGGEAKVGYDSRVGLGVYTSHQGSLSNAINQHLASGQPRSTLGRTGMGLQSAANAKGHIPNFFEGTDAMGAGMGLSMLAFAFMGAGENAEKASKKMLQNTYLDEKNKLKEASKAHRLAGEQYRNEKQRAATVQTNLDAERAAAAKPPKFGTTPAGLGGGATSTANIARLESELAKLNENVAKNSAAYDKARAATYTQAQTTAEARTAVNLHGKQIDPRTGKPFESKWAGRAFGGAKMMQGMALPLAFAGPMMGGMFAAGMPGTSREERRSRAKVQGMGNAVGYAGIGGLIGAQVGAMGAWGAAGGGPIGAAVGATVGLLTGSLAAATAGHDAYLKVLPELAAQSELASAALKDFQNGTAGFIRALGDYAGALRDTTGRLTPQDLKERRDVMMTAMGNIPEGARSKIIATMNDQDRMKAVMSKEQLKLAANAEAKSLAAAMGKAQDERRGGFWGTQLFESSNWNPWRDDKVEYSHRAAARSAHYSTGKSADDGSIYSSADWNNPLMRTSEGIDKLNSFTTKYVQTLDLGGKSTKELNNLMKEMSDVFDVQTDYAGYTQSAIMDVFAKLGGDVTAIRNSTLADAQYIASVYHDRLQALIVDAEMTELLTQSINAQKDAADKARLALERMQDVMQTVYMKTGNAVNALLKSVSTAEDIRTMRSAGKRGLMMSEMGLGQDLIKPFLGPQQSQRLDNAVKMGQILAQQTGTLKSIDSGIRKDLLKSMADEFGKSSTNMSKAFQSAVRGDRSKLESYLTKAGQTRPQANALANLTEMIGDRMRGGMGTDALMKFVQNQLNTNPNLSAITTDNTVMQNVLEAIRSTSESSYAALLKANEQTQNQLQLQELENTYALELIRVQKTLSYQGGIGSFTKGPHSGLLAVDGLVKDIQDAPSSISPTISEGISSFKSADMFKNFFGADNIPKELMGKAVAGRAQQMAQTAREYELQTGVELPGWMKDMGSEGTIEAATNQIQASLKDAVPAKLEEVRSQILKLQETLVTENANAMASMSAQFQSATENVFGSGAQNITGGGRGTIASLIEQQAKLFTMQVDQRKATDLQVDVQSHATRTDSARLNLLQRSNEMINAFRNLAMGTKFTQRDTSKETQQEFVTRILGRDRVVGPQAATASMAEIQELYQERLQQISHVLSGQVDKEFQGMDVHDAMRQYAERMKRQFVDGGEDFEDLSLTTQEQGAFMGRIQHGAEVVDKFVNDMYVSGGYQSLIEEYNQSVVDLKDVNGRRLQAENDLIKSISDFSSKYGHGMLPRTPGAGPRQVRYPTTAPIPAPVVRSGGGILESLGLRARGTDVVPAMLTPGEFIVNAKTTKKNRAFLEALNSGKVGYAAGGGLFSSQYPEGSNPIYHQYPRGRGAPGGLTLGSSYFSPTGPSAGHRATMGYGSQAYRPWKAKGHPEALTKKQITMFKDGVDTFVKSIKNLDVDTFQGQSAGRIFQALDNAVKQRSLTGSSDHQKSLRESSRYWEGQGNTQWAEQYANAADELQRLTTAASAMGLSLGEFRDLWENQIERAKHTKDPADQIIEEKKPWVKELEESFGGIPETLTDMEDKAKKFKDRVKEIDKELEDLRINITALSTGPAAAKQRTKLEGERRRLLTERLIIQKRQGPLAGAITREHARPGEVTDYTQRVREAQKRRKEGMRNLLGDIYGRYERPSQDEARDALKNEWGTEGFGKPTRREIENYRFENSQWKGMTNLGDSFINPQKQFGFVGDYSDRLNKSMDQKLADQFEKSGLDLYGFMKSKGLKMSEAQRRHGGMRFLEREYGVSDASGKRVKMSEAEKKAHREKERQEAVQMMRGNIFFRKGSKGGLEKVMASAANKKQGMWGYSQEKLTDHAGMSYDMREGIKDRPENLKKLEGIKGTIADLDKTISKLETDDLVAGRAKPSEELLAKRAERANADLNRQGLEFALKRNTPANLKKLNEQFDQGWHSRMDAAGVDKSKMLTDEFGNRLSPHEMADYLDQPKFKGTLDMGRLSQEYDKYSSSMHRSFDVMENLRTATEFRTKVQQRFAKVAKEAAKNGASVNDTMAAMSNEMKKVALDMKLARGEISGRAAREGNVQYYQGKVDSGTYGFKDMGGQFSSHFIRNARDDMQDMKDLIDSTATTMREGFKTAFKEFAFGTKSAKDAFRDLAMEITSNIFSRALDFGSENFMSYLMGQRRASGGLVRGYSSGGRVVGGTGPRADDVPMFGSGGEFVIQASAAKKIGYDTLDRLNTMGGNKGIKGFSRGGGISAVLRNQIDFDDPEQPKTMVKNIDPMLSMIGQEDQINPQNRKKFEREEAFYSYRKNEFEREKANREKMAAFKKQKKQMLKSGWMSAAMSLTSAAAAHYGDTNAIGKFLNSTGGKMAVSAGIGGAFGGTKGAIMGGISGLGAGLMGKWQKEHEAKQAMEFEKDLSAMMAKPSFQRQLALQKERQGLSTLGPGGLLKPFSTASQSDVMRDRNRLSAVETELHQLNPAFPNPNPPKAKSFWSGLGSGAKKFGQGLKKTPGTLLKGMKAPFTRGFWGFGNDRAWGGLVRRASGGIVSDPSGQFSQMNTSFGANDVMDTTSMSPQAAIDGSNTLMGGLGMVKDSAMYANGGKTKFGLDNLLARVSKGEYIFSPEATRMYGADALDALNKGNFEGFLERGGFGGLGGNVKGFAQGGYVGSGLPTLSAGGDLTGGTNTFDAVNQNLVRLIDSVEGVRETIETQGNATEESPNSRTGGNKGNREIANNISISVHVDKSGQVSSRNENDSQSAKGGESGNKEKDSDRKDKEKNKKLAEMMEVQILQVITEQKRPGGLLDDKG